MKPIPMTWDGDAMVPVERFRTLCDRQYAVGQVYPMLPHEQRTRETHNHYFAAIEEGWSQLPEDLAPHFLTSEHLRKFALIRSGFADSHSIVCSSKAEAQRLAQFIRPCDEFSVVDVSGATVTRFTAKSQSMKAMGKAEFQRSKQAVLDYIASLVGVPPAQLEHEAGRAA